MLRKSLVGLKVSAEHEVKLSAHAIDICILVKDSKDVGLVEENLELFKSDNCHKLGQKLGLVDGSSRRILAFPSTSAQMEF